MPNVPKKFRSPFVPHLSDVQLLAYQDGEMSRAEYEATRGHVETCWICRNRLGMVQENIDCFLEARKALLPESSAFAESRVEQFRQRLERHATESEGTGSVAGRAWGQLVAGCRAFAQFTGEHRKAALASVLAVCLLVVMFTDVLNTRVSADTVLARSQGYELQHLPAQGQVSKVSVRVERIEGSHAKALGTIVAVRDSESPESYWLAQSDTGSFERTVEDPALVTGNMLRTVLPADPQIKPLIDYLNQQQWVPDISPDGFRRLVSSRGSSEFSAHKTGDVFELRYPFAPGHASGITEARLVVRASDYGPISLSILTSAEHAAQEYRFTRTSLATEPRSAELAHLIGPQVGTAGASAHSTPSTPGVLLPPRVVPLNYANSHATVEEIDAAAALHKVDACLGEEVYLFPMSDGSLLVQGLVDSPLRRDAIRQALRAVSGPLRVEIFVPRELKNGSELLAPPDHFVEGVETGESPNASVPTTLADLSSASMPLHDRIYKHLARPGADNTETKKEVAIFSNEVVTHARQTFLHAWALKKLDREFSADRVSGLPASALNEVDKIRQDHQKWVANLAERQAEMLSTIAELPVSSVSGLGAEQANSDELLHLAREQNDLVRSLFTNSQAGGEPSGSLARLIVVLRRMGG